MRDEEKMTFGTSDGSLAIRNGGESQSTSASKEKGKSVNGTSNGNGNTNDVHKRATATILHPSLVLKDKADIPDPEEFLELEEELEGWHGYIEWEKYPERKRTVWHRARLSIH